MGTANGSCDVKNGGGNFGPNAYNLSGKTLNGRGFRLAAVLVVITVLAALLIMLVANVFQQS